MRSFNISLVPLCSSSILFPKKTPLFLSSTNYSNFIPYLRKHSLFWLEDLLLPSGSGFMASHDLRLLGILPSKGRAPKWHLKFLSTLLRSSSPSVDIQVPPSSFSWPFDFYPIKRDSPYKRVWVVTYLADPDASFSTPDMVFGRQVRYEPKRDTCILAHWVPVLPVMDLLNSPPSSCRLLPPRGIPPDFASLAAA